MKYSALESAMQKMINTLAPEWKVSTVRVVIPDTLTDFMKRYGNAFRNTAAVCHYSSPSDNEIGINPVVLPFFKYPRGTRTLLHEFLHYVWITRWGHPETKEMRDFEHSAMNMAAEYAPDFKEFWQSKIEPILPIRS